jgi:hypothetical protein
MRRQLSSDELPKSLPKIELQHAEALWVLARLGFQGPVTRSTFYEYIKSLRKLGTPFERGEIGKGSRRLANYSYSHLMELALVLTLRVYHVVPDAVLIQLVRYRSNLLRIYNRAYAEQQSGRGAPINVKIPGGKSLRIRGAFVDLRMSFAGGKLASFGPPQLLSPGQALRVFATTNVAARAFLPINISALAERLVWAAPKAPVIRNGPPPSCARRSTRRDNDREHRKLSAQ